MAVSQVNWTDMQSEAIRLRGKNIIVSAAAGSGKTAVLVERIKQLILTDNVSIDELLVATFTNAAAGDMKEKIIKAIKKEISERPERSVFLKNQLNLMYKANINTFHSFALEVIRRYFHRIGIDPNFTICDETEKAILQGEALDQIFEEAFVSGDLEFIHFLRCYGSAKSEKKAKEMVLSVYQMIQSLPEPMEWLAQSVRQISDSADIIIERLLPFIMQEAKSNVRDSLSAFTRVRDLLLENGLVNLGAKCEKDMEAVLKIADLIDIGNHEDAIREIKSITYERFAAAKDEKATFEGIKEAVTKIRNKGKDSIKDIKEKYFSESFEEAVSTIWATGENAVMLMKLVQEFERIYGERKREKNLIDFNDAEHYALEILKDKSVSQEYREKFRYIFVDEYQDSNLLQETLIGRICRQDNVFMVGDVKQSIYKFRLAEPELFLQKYAAFQQSTTGMDAKIDLSTNFRCKEPIIKAVNLICKNIMPYDENAALRKGVSYSGPLEYPVELHLVETKEIEDEDIDPQINDMKKAELEASAAVELIQKAVGTEIPEEGKDGEITRKLEFRDIVILMRGVRNYGDKYDQVFAEKGIPTYMDDSYGFFDTLEIEVFVNLLRVIDNKRQDIPLLSVLRSVIMKFELEELAEIRVGQKLSTYYEAFHQYSMEGTDERLRDKCVRTLEKIREWKALSGALSLDELLWKLMWDTGYYLYVGALPGGRQRQANLRALIDKAIAAAKVRTEGLYGFIQYVDVLKQKGIQIGQISLAGENDNVVRIKTIHKSKGLEYPMVIVAGLGKQFMAGRDGGAVSLHKDIGMGLTYVLPEEKLKRKTLIQNIIETRIKSENMDEEARILYVALTRAKDRLLLLGTVKDAEKAREEYQSLDPGNRKMTNCFLDMIAPVFIQNNMPCFVYGRKNISKSVEKSDSFHAELASLLTRKTPLSSDEKQQSFMEKRMSFTYAYEKALTAKSKYTVSELNRKEAGVRYEKPFALPEFMRGKKGLTGADVGTAMHKVMENMDFSSAAAAFKIGKDQGYQYLSDLIGELTAKEVLMPQEAKAVPLRKFEAFLTSDLGRRASSAEQIYKETPFNLLKEIDGIRVIVQGVIDCYFCENGQYILLDYKTTGTAHDEEDLLQVRRQYAKQVAIYSEALEAIRGIKVSQRYLYLFGLEQAILV